MIWTSRSDIQSAYLLRPDETLAGLHADLVGGTRQLCIDQIDNFISFAGKDPPARVLVILDDNGESVFDLALFQQLLRDTVNLQVGFVVNQYSISNNISLDVFLKVLANDYFYDLRHQWREGRVALFIERQMFRSFEDIYLSPEIRRELHTAEAAYIKGVNFFETFQLNGITRYYCFTVT